MKRKLRFLAGACLFTATALFSGCSSDDDFLMDPVDSGTSQTRAVTNPDGTLTITFDDFDPGMLAGPTSAGENLYPKSVIRISQCCMAMRNPLISPRWTGKTALFLKTLPDRGYACPLFCPNKPVLRLTRIG